MGYNTADDAGVYRLNDECAIITTVDFFPPIVDDPRTFGRIAAANSLSDVYAMGGTPRLAMNIVGFPRELPPDVLAEILLGGMDKASEAGVLMVGGHSVEDREVKYGLSVTGFVHPRRLLTNAGARPGDALVLTKPIGVGVITSAMKAGRVGPEEAGEAVETMTTLNRTAMEAAEDLDVGACTDITGYGFLGHAMEMSEASGVSLVIRAADVPVLAPAEELVRKRSLRPRTMATTRESLMPHLRISTAVPETRELLLYDPQTSGGLLFSLAPQDAEELLGRLHEQGLRAACIGETIEMEKDWKIRVE